MRKKFIAENIANALANADDIDRIDKKAEMRKLYPTIHQKLTTGGWSAKHMVNWLAEQGLDLSVETFRVYLNEIDSEHGYVRSARKFTRKSGIRPAWKDQSNQALATSSQDRQENTPVATKSPGSGRPSILSTGKRNFGELEPGPIDGTVDLNQK